MKNVRILTVVFSAVAFMMGLSLPVQHAMAQTPEPSPSVAQQQDSAQPSDNPPSASKEDTFTGKIMKDGDKLVLSDPTGKTTYQLDDQQKARKYVNQNVKITGALDAATGTIRVSAIDPA